MLNLLFAVFLGLTVNCVSFEATPTRNIIVHNNGSPETTTSIPEPTTPEDSSIYCDYFPEPTETDEGNYGDGFCYFDGVFEEELLLRKTIITNDGTEFISNHMTFQKTKITRVNLLNFGRYHGATNAIDIMNERGNGTVEYYIDIFSGKGIRMFLEIYGFAL